jgi:hypothetical protein
VATSAADTSARRAPKEEEARLLHPEVSNRSPDALSSKGGSLIFSSSRSQGDADRALPRSRQGVEVGRGLPHEAALIKGAAGGRERNDGDERGPAQRGRSGGAAAGGGGPDGGHDHDGHRAVDSVGAGPGRR